MCSLCALTALSTENGVVLNGYLYLGFGLFLTGFLIEIIADKQKSKFRSNLDNKDIFSAEPDGAYFYSNGWHVKALYSIALGFIFAASTIWNQSLMNFNSYSWLIGAFISSLTYYLLASK